MSTTMSDKKCAYTEWQTPERILMAVMDYMRIDLDPATSPKNPTRAAAFFTPKENGLERAWSGNVYVNPPYGGELKKWTRKIYLEAARGVHIVALLPGQRFETKYWQHDILGARGLDAICFISGRLKFIRADGNPAGSNPFGSMLYIFNSPRRAKTVVFARLGMVLLIREGFLAWPSLLVS